MLETEIDCDRRKSRGCYNQFYQSDVTIPQLITPLPSRTGWVEFGWVGFKANCPLVGPRSTGEVPSVGSF